MGRDRKISVFYSPETAWRCLYRSKKGPEWNGLNFHSYIRQRFISFPPELSRNQQRENELERTPPKSSAPTQ